MLQEKYRPGTLSELAGVPCAGVLEGFDVETFPNLIFAGPEGAGKRTLFRALVKHLFGKESGYMGYTMNVEVSPSKTVEVDIMESDECLEVRLEGQGYSDKKILQKLAKDISETKSIQGFFSGPQKKRTKLLVVADGEYLTRGAQMALRRVIEQGAGTFRLVILTTSTGGLIEAFKSRFLTCRVPAKSDREVSQIIAAVLAGEKKTLSKEAMGEVVRAARGNLRQALALVELLLCDPAAKLAMGWETKLAGLAKQIMLSPSIAELVAARATLYDVLETPVPGKEILSALLDQLLAKESSLGRMQEIAEYAAVFDARLSQGTKELFHLEAFVARAMSLYSRNK